MISRRKFFRWAAAGTVIGAAGIIIPEMFVPNRTIFLPPKGGWQQRRLIATWNFESMEDLKNAFDRMEDLRKLYSHKMY